MNTIIEFKRIKPGDSVVLTDDQTISELLEAKAEGATEGLSLRVACVKHLREQNKLAEWFFARLDGHTIPLVLMIKVVDEELDVRVCYEPDDSPPGTRADQLNRDHKWLFREPEDSYFPCNLEMAGSIIQEHEGASTVYKVKGGTLYGDVWEKPTPGGLQQPVFAAITEYAVEDEEIYSKTDNPELVVLELGGLDEDGESLPDGGLMQILQGANVSLGDISLLSC